jgi:hypothetical protein
MSNNSRLDLGSTPGDASHYDCENSGGSIPPLEHQYFLTF